MCLIPDRTRSTGSLLEWNWIFVFRWRKTRACWNWYHAGWTWVFQTFLPWNMYGTVWGARWWLIRRSRWLLPWRWILRNPWQLLRGQWQGCVSQLLEKWSKWYSMSWLYNCWLLSAPYISHPQRDDIIPKIVFKLLIFTISIIWFSIP